MIDFLKKFRSELNSYRLEKGPDQVSIHINSLEIALCLCEYAEKEKRSISNNEECWFHAGLHLEYVLGGSDWEKLLDYYDVLYKKVIEEKKYR